VSGTPVVTANTWTAPDGTLTGFTLEDNDPAALEYIEQPVTGLTIAAVYTFSVWAKSNTASGMVLAVDGISQASHTLTGTAARYSYTFTATATSHTVRIFVGSSSDVSVTGSIDIWGGQLEARNTPSTYRTTTVSTATRSLDRIQVSTTGWPTATGDITIKHTHGSNGNPTASGYLFDTMATNNGVSLAITFTGTLLGSTGNGTSQSSTSSSALAWVLGQEYTLRMTWSGGTVVIYRDGLSVASGGSKNMPSAHAASAGLGCLVNGNGTTHGYISEFAIRNF
jgi:hypothetical protein